MLNYYLAFIFSFAFALLIGPFIIQANKKLKAQQTILHYVEAHQGKSGTPTMGGVIFIASTLFISLIFLRYDFTLALISLASFMGFGVLGFLDDFIKVKFKQNLGLKPYQKIIGQLGISFIIAWFCFSSGLVGSEVILPFTAKTITLKAWIVPVVVFVFVATTNSVNLTDGLDGLATGVSLIYFISAIFLLLIYQNTAIFSSVLQQNEITNLLIVCFSMVGGLLAFLCFNGYPAKIFMGDTGSLAIGGLIASIMCLSKTFLFIPFLGIMFVVSTCSVILQVFHYKRTKQRIFLMAPLHHHFEKKGMNENKIVIVYIVITTVISFSTVLLTYILL